MSVLEAWDLGSGGNREQAAGHRAAETSRAETGNPAWPRLRAAPDTLPSAVQWRVPERIVTDQEPLDFQVTQLQPQPELDVVSSVCTVPAWSRPATGLPDAASVSVSLAQALIETLHGHRPVQQLTRWVTDTVLAAISWRVRANRTPQQTPNTRRRPVTLRSVRVQYPTPEVAEVSVHLVQQGRSLAMAFRLEGWSERWICTALELG